MLPGYGRYLYCISSRLTFLILGRYYGVNDPVADKLLNRAKGMPNLEPPEDKSITTLYIGGTGTYLRHARVPEPAPLFGPTGAGSGPSLKNCFLNCRKYVESK